MILGETARNHTDKSTNIYISHIAWVQVLQLKVGSSQNITLDFFFKATFYKIEIKLAAVGMVVDLRMTLTFFYLLNFLLLLVNCD